MAKGNGHQDPKIASLDAARRRAAERERSGRRAAARQGSGPRSPRDWLIGGLFVAMALGMVAWAGLWVLERLGGG